MSHHSSFHFPRNFVWGVSAAAPQIEGSSKADGKGESVWDRYAKRRGTILNGDKLDPACDHYRRFRQDFALMRELGITNYRLSLAWPRIYPEGDGALNQAGLDFYETLVDSMLENGITPWVTMFHWDLPQALEDRGGWRSRVVPEAFATYADTIVKTLGDRVKNWITVNEIRCFTTQAYGGLGKAPGVIESKKVVNQTVHNALVCHGHAVRAVRQHGGRGAKCGLSDNCETVIPVTESEPDVAAAREWFADANLAILDPIYKGRYSDKYLKSCGRAQPKVESGDFELIGQPTDFLGLNIYAGLFVRRGKDGKPQLLLPSDSYPRTDSPWLHLAPRALYWAPRLVADVYGVKNVYVTENGCGYDDDIVKDGEVLDLHRVEYLRSYLKELQRSIEDGTPVRGYFVWCFLDNFEWTDGYTRRFGIVHNNFKTQKRTPKLSAKWYGSVVAANQVL
jgi:beta-glucosidase